MVEALPSREACDFPLHTLLEYRELEKLLADMG